MNRKQKLIKITELGIIVSLAICQPSFGQTQEDKSNARTYDTVLKDLKTSLKHNRVQVDKLGEEIDKLKAGIASLRDSVESNSDKASEQIGITRNETAQKIDEIVLRHSALKQELEDLAAFQRELKGLVSAYNEESVEAIERVVSKNSMLKLELEGLSKQQSELRELISANNEALSANLDSLKKAHDALAIDVRDLGSNTGREIITIRKDMLNKFLFIGSGIFVTFLMIITVSIGFQKKFKKVDLVEERVKLDAKVSEILENQLVIMKKGPIEQDTPRTGTGENDHSLPISVGSEIFRMRKRIANMDESTKGLKALNYALERLENEFNNQGYAVKDLTGEPYVDGLLVKVHNYIERDDLDPDTETISRMIAPQIFHKGVLVSEGEVEVATSSKASQKHNGGSNVETKD